MLNNLKAWFSKLFNILFTRKKKEPLATKSAAQPSNDYTGVDIQFYTKQYSITKDDKKMLVSLVQRPEFRVFEKYLDWRVNASAHRMKALLIEGKKDEASAEASVIESLVKVTQDMQNFWNEMKYLDAADEILLKDRSKKRPKPFGRERYNLNDEAQ